jgi:hypothetical protein
LFYQWHLIKVHPCHVALQYTESKMQPIDIPSIEQQARELRAAEIHRVHDLFAKQAEVVGHLATASTLAGLNAVSQMLRPLFSWNPQAHTPSSEHHFAPQLERLNDATRALFSWNPQDRRP